MKTAYLADHPEHLPELARWHFEEWGHLRSGDSLESRILRLQNACGRGRIPMTVIAFEDGHLLGAAMLVGQDMEMREEWTPWLASVYVRPDCRRRGVGTALVRQIMKDAHEQSVGRLYLFTASQEAFYARLGWKVLKRTLHRGERVVVMAFDRQEGSRQDPQQAYFTL